MGAACRAIPAITDHQIRGHARAALASLSARIEDFPLSRARESGGDRRAPERSVSRSSRHRPEAVLLAVCWLSSSWARGDDTHLAQAVEEMREPLVRKMLSQIKCKNLVVGIAGKIVWGWEKRKVKRSFQYTLSSRRSRCVVIAIRFFANLIVSIDLDKAPRSGELLVR
jgi:hypothetical protein